MIPIKKIPKTAPANMAGINHHALIMFSLHDFVLANGADLTAFRDRITADHAPVDHQDHPLPVLT